MKWSTRIRRLGMAVELQNRGSSPFVWDGRDEERSRRWFEQLTPPIRLIRIQREEHVADGEDPDARIATHRETWPLVPLVVHDACGVEIGRYEPDLPDWLSEELALRTNQGG